MAVNAPVEESSGKVNRIPMVDCDVHQSQPAEALLPYLPPFYRKRGVVGFARDEYKNPLGGSRRDASPPDGGRPGSSPDFLREQLLDKYGIDYVILTGGMTRAGLLPDTPYATALTGAYNDYIAENWLPLDDRFLGSITIVAQDPEWSANEIRRLGEHPKFVQAMINSTTQRPLGQKCHDPIFEAAEEMGLPISLHPGGEGTGIANPPTPNGYPTTYLEWHTDLGASYLTQVCSLVCEGAFVKFPKLKVICAEGGLSWVPHLMWRLDKNWKGLRHTVPWLTRLPSEYIVDHVRFTTQPIEEPHEPKDLLEIFRMMYAEKTLLFSSDYPHWDFDSPRHAFPKMPRVLAERIFYQNAQETFRLPGDLDHGAED